MIIDGLLRKSPASADEVNRSYAAYRKTLRALCLVDRDDPVCEIVARRIIEISATGIGDPGQISRVAIEEFGYGAPSRPVARAAARRTSGASNLFRSFMGYIR